MTFAVRYEGMSPNNFDGDRPGDRTELTGRESGEVGTAPRITAFWDGGSLAMTLPSSGSLTIGRSSDRKSVV